MKVKNIKPKFVPYTENPDYRTYQDYSLCDSIASTRADKWLEDEYDLSKWKIDDKYKQYAERYLETKLTKGEYKRIVNKIIHLQKKGRITSKEGEYLHELWRAIEPLHPFVHLSIIKKGGYHYKVIKNSKSKSKKARKALRLDFRL